MIDNPNLWLFPADSAGASGIHFSGLSIDTAHPIGLVAGWIVGAGPT